MNFTATSSPVSLARHSLATPKLPLPISLICRVGDQGRAGQARVTAIAAGGQPHCKPPIGGRRAATRQFIFAPEIHRASAGGRPGCRSHASARSLAGNGVLEG